MDSIASEKKPHAVCIPFPTQGHITPMLKLAKLLHSLGFHITFVNTESNHRRLLRSRGPTALDGLPNFQFTTISDGVPPSDDHQLDATHDVPALFQSIISGSSLPLFRDILGKINESSSGALPRVTCVIADSVMTFALDAAKEIGIPCALLFSAGSCSMLAGRYYEHLVEKGLIPLKDMNQLTNGYLDTPIDFLPGFNNMRLRDFPTFIRTTDPNDFFLNFILHVNNRASMASAIIFNSFDELERPVLDALASLVPPIYTIGPLSLLQKQINTSTLDSLGSNLWKEQASCLEWLEGKSDRSVVYVNFGSSTMMSKDQLVEFAWGLANSNYDFLWIIRHDLVNGETTGLPEELLEEIKDRGFLVSWCPQEEVLMHPSIGGFLTHSGWNSTLESMSNGVPMLCWPFFADQQMNCRFVCNEWRVGMEMHNDVKRSEVESMIRELMGGEKGKEMKKRAMEWKERTVEATQQGGSSFLNLQRLVNDVLLEKRRE